MASFLKFFFILGTLWFWAPSEKITVYLIGDSTIADKATSTWPETGWGMPFKIMFDSTVVVDNRAKNGRSSRTFIDENLWQPIVDNLKQGDYVLIQFGHNDEAKEKLDRYTYPDLYGKNLLKFIHETRAKKAIPVLITPVSRRRFKDGNALETHAEYSPLVREIATAENVPLIDLDTKSRALLQDFGEQGSKLLFLQLEPGEHPNYPEGRDDNTHFSELGARKIAQIVLEEVRNLKLDLASHIVRPVTKPKIPAFPGANGFGKYTTGGRDGRVVMVTNLNDSGAGSLREAVRQSGARTILFSVAGNIKLKSPLKIAQGNVTIAGQSAPGDGICIQDYPVQVGASNVIIRYLRFRLGDERKIESDAFGGTSGKENIIIDHCSISWSTDECASFYRNRNFTLQWCIISESLNQSVHVKGAHGYGAIWGGSGASFHHNLFAHHTNRVPRFSGSSTTPNPPDELVDFRNNVIYNWALSGNYGGERGRYNVVNNYYKPGPANHSKKPAMLTPSSPLGKFYVDGNTMVGNPKSTADNWSGGVKTANPDSCRVLVPFNVEPIEEESAQVAFDRVLKEAGASRVRDAVDQRVVNDVATGQAAMGKARNGIIDSQSDVGGWPLLKGAPAPKDSDLDGMPDQWEVANHLNPNSAVDAYYKTISKQYNNLEHYLNECTKPVNAK